MLIAPAKKSRYQLFKKDKIENTELESVAKNIVCFNCKKTKHSKNECFYGCNDCNEVFCHKCIVNCFKDGLFNAGMLLD